MTTEAEKIGYIAIGVVIGMILSGIFIIVSVNSVVNNILPKVQIGSIEIGFNESKIIEWANQSLKESQDPEWMYYAPAMNFSCFGMLCSPVNQVYIKGVGVCYNQSEGIVCPF